MSDLQLYNGFLLTEESTAQSFLEHIVIPRFAPSLDGHIKIVASDGADDVQTRYNLLHRLHVFQFVDPAYKRMSWVLCDGDDKGKHVIGKLKGDFPEGAEHFYNLEENKQIEHYYPSAITKAFLESKGIASLDALLHEHNKEKKRELKQELFEEVMARKSEPDTFFQPAAQGLINIISQIEL